MAGAYNQTISINTPVIQTPTTGDTILIQNLSRLAWNIQNCGTNPLFVRLGAGATTSLFHYVLKAGSGTDDGLGGTVGEGVGVVYTGPISVAGTSPRLVVMEH